jgi:signal transduction histidine kinase
MDSMWSLVLYHQAVPSNADRLWDLMRWRPSVVDIGIAALLLGFMLVETIANAALHPKALFIAAAVASAGALLWRRRAPLAVVVLVTAAQLPVLLLASSAQLFFSFLLAVVGVFAQGAYATTARGYLGLAFLIAVFVVSGLTDGTDHSAGDFAYVVVLFIGTFALGRLMRRTSGRADLLAARTVELEVERDERAHEAVAEERARIARELHDVIAHSVSVMVIQAGAAEQLLDSSPARARAPLVAIQDTGRQAVAELGRLLGMLRAADEYESLDPQPRLKSLGALIEDVRATGLLVTSATRGVPRDLPPGLELAAYRVVQEALTNTRKHAGATAATITLAYEPDALCVEIIDDGGNAPNAAGGGHGLVGMRERVALYGGSLTAERCGSRGFRVAARFPIDGHAR